MITFIKRFLDSLTDEELEYLRSQADVVAASRENFKHQQRFGAQLPLPMPNEHERALYKTSKINAIKAYRIRVNCGLKEAKDVIERWCPASSPL